MRIYQHFSVVGFCNTYVVGQNSSSDAIIIDPGHVDNELISIIEKNKFVIKTILLTHRHESHTSGVGTLLKLYNPKIYAYTNKVYEFEVNEISGGTKLNCDGIEVEVIHLRSLLIKIIKNKLLSFDDNLLVFPGHGAPTKIKNERLFNPDLTEETASPWLRNQIALERNNRF